MGLPAFQKRYVLHDMDSFFMSFAPLTGSGAEALTDATLPDKKLSRAGPSSELVLSVFAVYFAGCYMLYRDWFEPTVLQAKFGEQ